MNKRLTPITTLRASEGRQDRKIIAAAAALLKKCGWTAVPPLVVVAYPDGDYIKDGHHRYEAAKKLGLKEVLVVDADSMNRGDRAAHGKRLRAYRELIKHPLATCVVPKPPKK